MEVVGHLPSEYQTRRSLGILLLSTPRWSPSKIMSSTIIILTTAVEDAAALQDPHALAAGLDQLLPRRFIVPGWDYDLAFQKLKTQMLNSTLKLAITDAVIIQFTGYGCKHKKKKKLRRKNECLRQHPFGFIRSVTPREGCTWLGRGALWKFHQILQRNSTPTTTKAKCG